jgi:hypothetical protein
MSEYYDTSWDLKESEEGNLSENKEAFEKYMKNRGQRDWVKWLGEHLSFPFTLQRMPRPPIRIIVRTRFSPVLFIKEHRYETHDERCPSTAGIRGGAVWC